MFRTARRAQNKIDRLSVFCAAAVMVVVGAFVCGTPVSNADAAGGKPTSPPQGDQVVTGPGLAKSGDMVTVSNLPIRILGISAPVSGQKCQTRYGHPYDCYKIATEVLQALINTRAVKCIIKMRDRNGQRMGYCSAEGVDLGAAMVSRGWAFAYRGLSLDYSTSEAYAQSLRIGMWAGLVEKPWQYQSRILRERAK